MNKLREKLNDSIITNIEIRESENRMHFEYNHLELAEKCEQITDDFTCKFTEWSFWFKRREYGGEMQFYYCEKNYTLTELQQYFKENIYGK